jgi:hypothetical protein
LKNDLGAWTQTQCLNPELYEQERIVAKRNAQTKKNFFWFLCSSLDNKDTCTYVYRYILAQHLYFGIQIADRQNVR